MKKLLVFASLILIPLVLMGSCTQEKLSIPSQYKTFAVTRGIAHFSFEYDQSYFKEDKNPISITTDKKGMAASIEGPNYGSFNYTQFVIQVWLQNSDPLAENATIILNLDVKTRSLDPGFKLLEQSSIIVDGIKATQLVFSERNTVAPILGKTDQGYSMTHRKIYFDYNGLVWRFELQGDSTNADFDKAQLDHILQTFKFLP